MSDRESRGSKSKRAKTDQPESVMAMAAPRVQKDNPLTRSTAGLIGLVVLAILVIASLGSIPWTFSPAEAPRRAQVVDGELIPPRLGSSVRYNAGNLDATLLPPSWWNHQEEDLRKLELAATEAARQDLRQAALDELNQQRVNDFINENPNRRNLRPQEISQLGLLVGELPADIEVAEPTEAQIEQNKRFYLFGTDNQGRDVFIRTLAGGAISIGIGIAAAGLSVFIGTLYGAIAGYIGGTTDAIMMRIVDVLYGLPYILLVVLLAVAGEALVDRYDNHIRVQSAADRYSWMVVEAERLASDEGIPLDPKVRVLLTPPPAQANDAEVLEYEAASAAMERLRASESPSRAEARRTAMTVYGYTRGFDPIENEILATLGGSSDLLASLTERATSEQGLEVRSLDAGTRTLLDVLILLAAIGGVSWLTMARVIRGQVLSLKSQPFMEAARSIGTPVRKQFRWHLLPNLLGPIIVYATLTVPQAVLQESFLSFLGIGVQAPLPSWGNLAAQGLNELNTIRSRWWLLLFPCLMLGITLLALNFVGEGLREAFDPKRARK
jgi:ABC-type dipeptide/oligopeptide/nickel transport system permease subunit